jgi:hypothetical protein
MLHAVVTGTHLTRDKKTYVAFIIYNYHVSPVYIYVCGFKGFLLLRLPGHFTCGINKGLKVNSQLIKSNLV